METSLQSIQVLHVDDEPGLAEIAAEYLQRSDDQISADIATTAKEGLDLLLEYDYDCVVSDYDMPGQDGIEFLEAVREENADLPFILYTGKGSEEVASEAIAAGVSDYLQKESGTSQFEVLANRIRNLVEKRRSEEEISEWEYRTHRLLEHSSDFLFVVDEIGEISYISPSVKRLLGYDQEDLIGEDAFEFIYAEDMEKAMDAFAETLERPDEEVSVEFRANHADGAYRWLEVRGRNLLDDPVIKGVIVNARDITERKKKEHELEATRADYEALFEASPVPIWVQGLREIHYANEAAAQFHGVSDSEELIGRSAMEFVPEDEVDVTLRRNRRMLDKDESVGENHGTMVTDVGEERQAIFSAAPITYRGEQALVAFALDISD